jgi:2-iminobutanoate/2-iminopropanoate deaminase
MKSVVFTKDAPVPVGPYSQAVEINGVLYVAGQVAIDPETGKFSGGSIQEQTERVMKNIGAILAAADYSFGDVVKSTCLLADIADFKAMNEVYGHYYPVDPPARAAFAVRELPLGALIEIETVAMK